MKFRYKGWVGLCPVYIRDIEEVPVIIPRVSSYGILFIILDLFMGLNILIYNMIGDGFVINGVLPLENPKIVEGINVDGIH